MSIKDCIFEVPDPETCSHSLPCSLYWCLLLLVNLQNKLIKLAVRSVKSLQEPCEVLYNKKWHTRVQALETVCFIIEILVYGRPEGDLSVKHISKLSSRSRSLTGKVFL